MSDKYAPGLVAIHIAAVTPHKIVSGSPEFWRPRFALSATRRLDFLIGAIALSAVFYVLLALM